tara:strand:+ start:13766 stop:14932 length:1167 start_codon:yes stop_codon:yes gene_type:complete
MSFGEMPLANGFLQKKLDDEYFFELEIGICDSCYMFQIISQPDPKKMFHQNYAFISGTSNYMKKHFAEFADDIIKRKSSDLFVVEIGSNDGIMLEHLSRARIKHVGIEPSKNVADLSKKKGVNVINSFFDIACSKKIQNDYSKADIIFAANVMCHIPDINEVMIACSNLLKENGRIIFEDPYLGSMIEKNSYDQIYDEHVFLFSASSIKNMATINNLELIDLKEIPAHGGSMRYTLAHKGINKVSDNVENYLAKEKELGLFELKTYKNFKNKCEKSKNDLKEFLINAKKNNKRVIGYGATSKSTTILNYCGIRDDLLECIVDITPTKQGKFSPGMHIPIKSFDYIKDQYPDYFLLLAWNHQKEILDKEKSFGENGGKWIKFFPNFEIL